MKLDMGAMLKMGFLVAILFPIIVDQLVGVNTSGWDATLVTIWDNLPIFAGIAVLFAFLTLTDFGQNAVRRVRGGK